MTADTPGPALCLAIEAAQEKQAAAITLLDLTGLGAFTEAFVLCTGFSTPQVAAIADGIEHRLRERGIRPIHREGQHGAEWLLLDYGRFVVHIFTERLRLYYDLERLWRAARRTDIVEPRPGISAAGGSGLNLLTLSKAEGQPDLKEGSGS